MPLPLPKPCPVIPLHAARAARPVPSIRQAARDVVAVTLASFTVAACAQPASPPAPPPSGERVTAEAAFARADTNGDLRLSRGEAARYPAIAQRFDEFDTDRDGLLTPDEFAKALKAPM